MAKDTARVEAFSDGVFAIAITLLILDVKVPVMSVPEEAATNHWLLGRLAEPEAFAAYAAYLMSFLTILVMWVNHHRILSLVEKVDHRFLFWNGLLLMLISIVPFPTSLLARYFLTPSANIGAAVYAGHGFLIALGFQGVWQHAIRDRRLLAPGTDAEVAKLSAQYRYGPLMYLMTFALAFVSAWASAGLCLLFVVFFSLQGFTQKG